VPHATPLSVARRGAFRLYAKKNYISVSKKIEAIEWNKK
jgi:hypothetical protein